MKRKYLIYLLTFLMAFSPAAVFADINDGEAADNAGNPVAEAVETAEPAAAEEVAAEAAAAEAAPEEPAAENLVAVEAAYEENDIYTWVEGSGYTKAEKDGVEAKGVFKAKRIKDGEVAGTSLFYANDSNVVEHKEQVVHGSGYIHE